MTVQILFPLKTVFFDLEKFFKQCLWAQQVCFCKLMQKGSPLQICMLHKPIWNMLKAFVLQLMHFAIKPNSTCVSIAPPLVAIMGRSWVSKLLIYNLVPMQDAKIKPRYKRLYLLALIIATFCQVQIQAIFFEKFSSCCELLKLLNPAIGETAAI